MIEPTADDPLLAWRDRFPILSRSNYLISNSLGAAPDGVADALEAYYEAWASRGVRAWEEGWWELAAGLGDRVAGLLGAGASEVVFQPSVTIAHAVVFSGFDFGACRTRVVTDAMHFPSILYLIEGLRDSGAEIVVVPSDDGLSVDPERIIGAIDERTAFVNVSHVLFKSSFVQDVAAIAERARRVGVVTIIDGYQAVGSIPVDVAMLGVDVYIGGCLKWLCGGPGAAFLWVRPELRARLAPRLTGWMAHERPFAFDPDLTRRGDAWRFLHGTPNIPALYAAGPGLEIIAEVGPEAIRGKSIRQTRRLIELAEQRGFGCNCPIDADRRGGTVAIDVPHGLEVSRALKALEILCDYRPGAGIRLSPHFYTRDEELDAAVAALGEILENEEWRRHAVGSATVT